MGKKVAGTEQLYLSGLGILALLLFLSCAVIGALLFLTPAEPEQPQIPATPPPPPSQNETNQTPQNQSTGLSQEDLETWNLITVNNVESVCLAQAKEEAGNNAALVYDCECKETVSPQRKTYGCEIDTADPFSEYFANIDCFLLGRACSLETNYGTQVISFEQLREFYGNG